MHTDMFIFFSVYPVISAVNLSCFVVPDREWGFLETGQQPLRSPKRFGPWCFLLSADYGIGQLSRRKAMFLDGFCPIFHYLLIKLFRNRYLFIRFHMCSNNKFLFTQGFKSGTDIQKFVSYACLSLRPEKYH